MGMAIRPLLVLLALLSIPFLLPRRSLAASGSDTRSQILEEINRVRQSPAAYAAQLEANPPRSGVRDRAALADAVKTLRGTKPRPPLALSEALNSAARDHVSEQGQTTKTGHSGQWLTGPMDRVARYDKKLAYVGEAIYYGNASPGEIVAGLVVDSGVRSRGHRKLLLDPGFELVGIATGPHQRYGAMCVIDLAAP